MTATPAAYLAMWAGILGNARKLLTALGKFQVDFPSAWREAFGESPSWSVVYSGLKSLGLGGVEASDSDAIDRISRNSTGHLPPIPFFRKRMAEALTQSFPIRSVVSNRIMGSCIPELVNNLWESPGLLRTFASYPKDLYLLEMTLFGTKIAEALYYVPIPLPLSRRSTNRLDDFFLSFAVAMAAPSVIAVEDFREVVTQAGQDLYLAMVDDAQQLLVRSIGSIRKCQVLLAEGATSGAQKAIAEFTRDHKRAALDLLRLHHPHGDSQGICGLESIPWGFGEKRLTSRTKGESKVALAAPFNAAMLTGHIISEWPRLLRANKYAIDSRRLRGVDHSGITYEFRKPVAVLQRMQAELHALLLELGASDVAPQFGPGHRETLACVMAAATDALDALSSIEARWRLLAERARGDCCWTTIDETSARKVLEHAWRLAQSKGEVRQGSEPHFTVDLAGHFVLESEAGLLELAYNLLSNLLKHEADSLVSGDWGLSLTWEPLCTSAPWKRKGASLWRPEFRVTGTAVLEAYPSSLSCERLAAEIETLKGMGLWVTQTLTRAYIAQNQPELTAEQIWDTASVRVENRRLAVLLPAR